MSKTLGSLAGLGASPGRGPGLPVTMSLKPMLGVVLILIGRLLGLSWNPGDNNGGVLLVPYDTFGAFVVLKYGD